MKEVWFFGKRYLWTKVDGRLELVRWPRLPDVVVSPGAPNFEELRRAIIEIEPTEDGWRQFARREE